MLYRHLITELWFYLVHFGAIKKYFPTSFGLVGTTNISLPSYYGFQPVYEIASASRLDFGGLETC